MRGVVSNSGVLEETVLYNIELKLVEAHMAHSVLWAHLLLFAPQTWGTANTGQNELSNTNAVFFLFFIHSNLFCSLQLNLRSIIHFFFLGTSEYPCIALKVVQLEQQKDVGSIDEEGSERATPPSATRERRRRRRERFWAHHSFLHQPLWPS